MEGHIVLFFLKTIKANGESKTAKATCRHVKLPSNKSRFLLSNNNQTASRTPNSFCEMKLQFSTQCTQMRNGGKRANTEKLVNKMGEKNKTAQKTHFMLLQKPQSYWHWINSENSRLWLSVIVSDLNFLLKKYNNVSVVTLRELSYRLYVDAFWIPFLHAVNSRRRLQPTAGFHRNRGTMAFESHR